MTVNWVRWFNFFLLLADDFLGMVTVKMYNIHQFGVLSLYFAILLFACQNQSGKENVAFYEYLPTYDGIVDVKLPTMKPCPDDWSEVEFDAGDNYRVTYCEPPNAGPVPPVYPDFLPCPQDWNEVEDVETGTITCQPFPEGLPMDCGSEQIDFAQVPGDPECARIGTACPDGLWAPNLPKSGNIVYVQAGASSGGNGTELSPFSSIQEAINFVGSDATIALSKGAFHESVLLQEGIRLWGACVAGTILLGNSANVDRGVITTESPDTGARNLQISGQSTGVSVTGFLASISMEDVVINEATKTGMRVDQSHSNLKNVVLRKTRSLPDGTYGIGIRIENGAYVEMKRTVFLNNKEVAIMAFGDSTILHVEDAIVQETQGRQSDGLYGIGLSISKGAFGSFKRTVFYKNRTNCVSVTDEGTTLQMEHVIVQDTQNREADGRFGMGLTMKSGARGDIKKSLFLHNKSIAVYLSDLGTILQMEDVVVRDTAPNEAEPGAAPGLLMRNKAEAKIERSLFHNNIVVGVSIEQPGTSLQMDNVIVRDTQPLPVEGILGRGLEIMDGANVDITRSLFFNNTDAGIVAAKPGTTLHMDHVVVQDTQWIPKDGTCGEGLRLFGGAEATINRSSFLGNRENGINARGEGTRLWMEDVLVKNTVSTLQGFYGRGLLIHDGAFADIKRSHLQNNMTSGIQISRKGTKVNLEYVFIRNTQSDFATGHGGRGMNIAEGAEVDVKRSVFLKNREVTISVHSEGSLLTMEDTLVLDTLMRQSSSIDRLENQHSCHMGHGAGLGVFDRAVANISNYVISNHAQCGLQIAHGAESENNKLQYSGIVNLSNGIISNNEICGVNVQAENYKLESLFDGVLYLDNNYNNLDTAELPLP